MVITMKKLIRYIALLTLLTVTLALALALASCVGKIPDETLPEGTTSPEEITTRAAARIDVHFAVVDQDGNAVSEAVFTILPDTEEGESATVNADEEGKCSVSLPFGNYTVRFDVLPEYVLGIETPVTVTENMAPVTLTVTDNTPNGTEERPFVITENTSTVTVPAGETFYFTLFGGNNRTLTVENANAEITYNGTTYTPDADGVVSVRLATESLRDHVLFALANKGSEDADMTVVILSDPGTMDNPIIVEELGVSITANVPQDGMVYYLWTATSDGTLRVASADSINNISLNNVTTSHVSNFTEGNETETLPVKAGDQITVVVSVIGGDRGAEHNPVTFTLTLEE